MSDDRRWRIDADIREHGTEHEVAKVLSHIEDLLSAVSGAGSVDDVRVTLPLRSAVDEVREAFAARKRERVASEKLRAEYNAHIIAERALAEAPEVGR